MNWYRFFKLSFSRTKSQRLTMDLSSKIFNIVKNNIGKDIDVTIKIDEQCDLFLHIKYVGNVNLLNKNFTIKATGFYSQKKIFAPSVHFNIDFNNFFSILDFPKLQYNLYNVVRHELGHYWQYLDSNFILDDTNSIYNDDLIFQYRELKDYILSEQEIDPYLRGLVFSSQKQKRPFAEILNENLDELFFENDSSTKEYILSSAIGKEVKKMIEDIKTKVIFKAFQTYPNSRLL